jgi:DNA topoisomerase-2
LKDAERKGLHKFFNLQTSLVCNNTLVVFDELGCLKKFNDTLDILREFYSLRLRLYVQRKDFMIGMLEAEAKKLSNQARFIVEKIEGRITIFNKAKKKLIQMLDEKGYDSDPVKAWQKPTKKETFKDIEQKKKDDDEGEEVEEGAKDFNYILNMPLWSLSKERKEALLKQRDDKIEELEALKLKTPKDLWRTDLDAFLEELDKVEEKERQDAKMSSGPKKEGKPKFGAKKPKKELKECLPSEDAIRVEPIIDADMKKRLMTKEPRERKPKKEKEPKNPKVDPNTQKIDGFVKKTAKVNGVKKEEETEVVKNGGNSSSGGSSAEKKKRSIVKNTNGMKQSKLGFNKMKSGKNPWETDSEGSDDPMSSDAMSSDDDGDDFKEKKKPAAAAPRRAAAAKAKFSFSSGESDNDDDDDRSTQGSSKASSIKGNGVTSVHSSPQSIQSSPKALSLASTQSTPASSKMTISSDESEDEPPSLQQRLQKKPEPAPKKKAPIKRKAPDSDEPKKKKAAPKPKKAAAPKPKSKTMDQFMKKPAAKKAKKKPAWESGSEDDEIDDFGGSSSDPDTPVKPRATTGRARKVQKTYKFSDSEEEDNDSDFC